MNNTLLILGCSDAKRKTSGQLPALDLYDGPMYKVLRKFLREYEWPVNLSVSVLSAEHALFGATKEIQSYDKKMDRQTANAISAICGNILRRWDAQHDIGYFSLGKEYLPAIEQHLPSSYKHLDGMIGERQSKLKQFLRSEKLSLNPRRQADTRRKQEEGLRYFLPDWDDLLDPAFDFIADEFSMPNKNDRNEQHCHRLMQPSQMCDGILVSLAQRQTSKGPLRRLEGTEPAALRPKQLRRHFGLSEEQFLFGDCGAFSYVGENEPTISTEQAIALYELYNFDFGTSVDHIPIKTLSDEERQARVQMTCDNAEEFINLWRKYKLFTPVGAVQGISPEQYAENVCRYYDMGYRHMAIGGLVPLKDATIKNIAQAVSDAASELRERPWIHLFGVFRPKLQDLFRELGIDSFDSASYFRKSWLRSDQNYLGKDGNWYAAVRVPMLSDPRTRKRLAQTGGDFEDMERQEQRALRMLVGYDVGEVGINETLDAVLQYDQQLQRSSDYKSMRDKYRRTLEAKPWLNCDCTFCQALGIQILIFRGGNRNRRRGAHNTLMLYGQLNREGTR